MPAAVHGASSRMASKGRPSHQPAGSPASGPVIVNSYENGVAGAVGDAGTISQGDEFIVRAGFDDVKSFVAQDLGQTAGSIEGKVFFGFPGDRAGPPVMPAMSGVYDDGIEMSGPGPVG